MRRDTGSALTRLPLAGTLAYLCLVTLVAAEPTGSAPPGEPVYLVDPDGVVLRWSPEDVSLLPAFDLPQAVNDLAQIPQAGPLLVLPADERGEAGKRRCRKKEGRVLVLDTGGRTISEIPIDGQGVRVSWSPASSTAYVLALRPGREASGGVGMWMHAIDIQAARMIDSIVLAAPPHAIALEPDGRRIYLARPDRIESLTTAPLVTSWHYRSPGENRGLWVAPGDGVLCVARGREIALFDPRLIAERSAEIRRRLRDDATLVIPLSVEATDTILSDDGRLGAALGRSGEIAFFDPAAGIEIEHHALIGGADPIGSLRPLRFPGAGSLVAAAFPGPSVIRVPIPAPAPPAEQVAAAAPPAAADDVTGSRPEEITPGPPPVEPAGEFPVAPPPVARAEEASVEPPIQSAGEDVEEPPPAGTAEEEAPPSSPAGVPEVAPPAMAPAAPLTLAGRLTGAVERALAIVVYGPGSIVREEIRSAPQEDGRWRATVSAPGRYRIVPIAPPGASIRSRPHFRTVVVKEGAGFGNLDFEILTSP